MNDNQNTSERSNNLKPVCITGTNPLRHILIGFVILFAGMVIGSALTVIIVRQAGIKPHAGLGASERITHNIKKILDLTESQSKAINPIINKHFKQLHEIKFNARPLIEKELNEMRQEISELLTEDQIVLWDKQIRHLERGFGPKKRMYDRGPADHDMKNRRQNNRDGRPNRNNPPFGEGQGYRPLQQRQECQFPEDFNHIESEQTETP